MVPGPPPESEPDRTTPASLLNYFAKAHEDRDVDTYAECLHPQYSFWFAEDDLEDPQWDWRDWIDKVEDRTVTGNMFASESVTHVHMTLFNLTTDPDTMDLWVRVDPGGGMPFTYYWGLFGIDLHVVEETEESEVDHWVDGRAHISFRPDPLYEGLWTIWRIADLGNEHKVTVAVERTTWSGVKAMYRKKGKT
jgi:hypothetical protein